MSGAWSLGTNRGVLLALHCAIWASAGEQSSFFLGGVAWQRCTMALTPMLNGSIPISLTTQHQQPCNSIPPAPECQQETFGSDDNSTNEHSPHTKRGKQAAHSGYKNEYQCLEIVYAQRVLPCIRYKSDDTLERTYLIYSIQQRKNPAQGEEAYQLAHCSVQHTAPHFPTPHIGKQRTGSV